MCALLSGTGGPSADELAARAAYRDVATAPRTRPPTLGPPPPPPPDPSGLPPGVARLMRATGIALGALFGSSEAEHEEHMLRGLAASPGVYEGPARLHLRPVRVRPDRPGRRPRHRVDDRGVQHPAAAARGDRDRQRRPALALGDRRARVRHPGRGRDARGDRAHRRRGARARRRRRRRGDGARVKRGRPARGGARRHRSSARRRSGSGRRSATGLPVPPGVALSGAIVEAVAAGEEHAIEEVAKLGPAARRPARRALVRRRRGRRRGELRRAAPDAAQRPVGGRADRGAAARSGGRRTRTRRSPTASASASSPGRASASSSSRCSIPRRAGVMFTQNPVTGADERMIEASWGLGEAVVAGLVIPDNYRVDRSGQVLERTPGLKKIAIRTPPDGRHGRGDGRARARRAALPRRRPARRAEPARRPVRAGLRPRPGHRMGDRRTGRSTCCSAGRSREPGPEPSRPRRRTDCALTTGGTFHRRVRGQS